MLYLLLITALLGVATWKMVNGLLANMSAVAAGSSEIDRTQQLSRFGLPLLMGTGACLMSGPILQTLVAVQRARRGDEVVIDLADSAVRGSWGLYMMMAAMPLLLASTAFFFKRIFRDKDGSFGTQGLAMLCAACALVTGMTLYSHYSFYQSSDDGTANLAFLQQSFGVTDIQCPAPTILLQRHADGSIVYRCPMSLAYLSFSPRPVVPWPDFKDGQSQKLIEAIHKIEAEADRPHDPDRTEVTRETINSSK